MSSVLLPPVCKWTDFRYPKLAQIIKEKKKKRKEKERKGRKEGRKEEREGRKEEERKS